MKVELTCWKMLHHLQYFIGFCLLLFQQARDEFNVVNFFFYRSRFGSIDKIALEIDMRKKYSEGWQFFIDFILKF